MANKLITLKVDGCEADGASVVGRIFNVYNTYANALTHGEDGLCTIYAMTVLTGAIGDAITQVAKTTGVTVDNNGKISFYVNDGAYTEVFLASVCGRAGGPIRIPVL